MQYKTYICETLVVCLVIPGLLPWTAPTVYGRPYRIVTYRRIACHQGNALPWFPRSIRWNSRTYRPSVRRSTTHDRIRSLRRPREFSEAYRRRDLEDVGPRAACALWWCACTGIMSASLIAGGGNDGDMEARAH